MIHNPYLVDDKEESNQPSSSKPEFLPVELQTKHLPSEVFYFSTVPNHLQLLKTTSIQDWKQETDHQTGSIATDSITWSLESAYLNLISSSS